MIKGLAADLIVTVYILSTLFLRFVVEHTLVNHPFISVGVGVVLLLVLWSLIKIKFLVPNYFGLLKKRSKS